MPITLQASFKNLVISKYTDWDNIWVHYTKEPYIKINPQAMHRDPAGIYLFPNKFETAPLWQSYPYKFIVEVPKNLKVLDFSLLSREDMLELARNVCSKEIGEEYTNLILKGDHFLSNGWEIMWMQYLGRSGEFNKKFRDLGYDAIFDDTRTIHSSEIQLLLLNPRKVKVIEMIKKTDSGYNDVLLVMDYVEELCENYGKVTVKKPKKKTKYGEEKLEGSILVEQGDKYVDLGIAAEYYPGSKAKEAPPIAIHVTKKYSHPDIGMGAGATFNRSKRSFSEIEKDITWLLNKVFR